MIEHSSSTASEQGGAGQESSSSSYTLEIAIPVAIGGVAVLVAVAYGLYKCHNDGLFCFQKAVVTTAADAAVQLTTHVVENENPLHEAVTTPPSDLF